MWLDRIDVTDSAKGTVRRISSGPYGGMVPEVPPAAQARGVAFRICSDFASSSWRVIGTEARGPYEPRPPLLLVTQQFCVTSAAAAAQRM